MISSGGLAAATLPFTGGHPIQMFVAGASFLFAGLAIRALAPNRHRDDGL